MSDYLYTCLLEKSRSGVGSGKKKEDCVVNFAAVLEKNQERIQNSLLSQLSTAAATKEGTLLS